MRPNNNTLTPSLAVEFSGVIWKLKVHTNGVIAIESRDSQLKQVAFSAFNFSTGESYFREHTYDESWNLTLAFLADQTLLLTGFANAESPESKGVLSVSASTGATIWRKFNIALNQVCNEAIEVFDPRFQPRKYYWLDHRSGEMISPPISNTNPENSVILPEVDNTFDFPLFIEPGEIVGEIYKLVYANRVFVSFHEVLQSGLQQRLIVYQGDKILVDDILISGIQKLQPEAFFIQQNHLFCVRNKREIITYFV